MELESFLSEKGKIARKLNKDIEQLETLYTMRKLYEQTHHVTIGKNLKVGLFQNIFHMLSYKIFKREYPMDMILEYKELKILLDRIRFLQAFLFPNLHEFNVAPLTKKEMLFYKDVMPLMEEMLEMKEPMDKNTFKKYMKYILHENVQKAANENKSHFQKLYDLLQNKKTKNLEMDDDNDDILERIKKIRESLSAKKEINNDEDDEDIL